MASNASARVAWSSVSVSSFASESSCTRPCSYSTRETLSRYARGFSETSLGMVVSSVGEDDPGLQSGRCRAVEPRTEGGNALGQEEVVERAHLALVLGAARDLIGAVEVELAIGRRYERGTGESPVHAPPLFFDAPRRVLSLPRRFLHRQLD